MSDRTFTTDVLPLLRPARPDAAVRGFARPVAARPAAVEPPAPPRAGLWAILRAGWRRQRTRRCLAELDAHMLKDIGISYAEAEAEANKPFWML
jgi:uncharacterized protein YjiS (DUF1127 family)